MSYELSFADEFFTGTGEDLVPSDKPTSVRQAALSLDTRSRLDILVDVFGMESDTAEIVSDDDFMQWVVDRVRKTDTCSDISSPVAVWIDAKGDWKLEIYDDENGGRVGKQNDDLPACTGGDEDVDQVAHLSYILMAHPDGQENDRSAKNFQPYCTRCDSFLNL